MATIVYEPKDTRLESIGEALGALVGQKMYEARKKREMAEFAHNFELFRQQTLNQGQEPPTEFDPNRYGGAAPDDAAMGRFYAAQYTGGQQGVGQPIQVPGYRGPSISYEDLLESAANVFDNPRDMIDIMLETSERQQERAALDRYQDAINRGEDPYTASLGLPPRLYATIAPTLLSGQNQQRLAEQRFAQEQQLAAQEHGYRMAERGTTPGATTPIVLHLPGGEETTVEIPEGSDPYSHPTIQRMTRAGWRVGSAPGTTRAGTQSYQFSQRDPDTNAITTRTIVGPAGITDMAQLPGAQQLLDEGFVWGSQTVGAQPMTGGEQFAAIQNMVRAQRPPPPTGATPDPRERIIHSAMVRMVGENGLVEQSLSPDTDVSAQMDAIEQEAILYYQGGDFLSEQTLEIADPVAQAEAIAREMMNVYGFDLRGGFASTYLPYIRDIIKIVTMRRAGETNVPTLTEDQIDGAIDRVVEGG